MGFCLSDMQVTSSAFGQREAIPARHTCEGADVSPHLAWRGAPDETAGFAVFCHDPDAPLVQPHGNYGFVHWVAYNIPAAVTELAEATTSHTFGANDMGGTGYGGPAPPPGHGVHQYYFWVLALDHATDLPEGLTLWQLLERVEASILGMNRLVGTYERK